MSGADWTGGYSKKNEGTVIGWKWAHVWSWERNDEWTGGQKSDIQG